MMVRIASYRLQYEGAGMARLCRAPNAVLGSGCSAIRGSRSTTVSAVVTGGCGARSWKSDTKTPVIYTRLQPRSTHSWPRW
eukprot:158716-Rhodomonas_salina.1